MHTWIEDLGCEIVTVVGVSWGTMYCKGCSENPGKSRMLLCLYKEYRDEKELAKGIEKKRAKSVYVESEWITENRLD